MSANKVRDLPSMAIILFDNLKKEKMKAFTAKITRAIEAEEYSELKNKLIK